MVVPQLTSSSYRVVFFDNGLTGMISFIVLLQDVFFATLVLRRASLS